MSEDQKELEEAAISQLGRLLAKQRWAHATPAQRKAQGKALARGRRKARKGRASK